MDAAGEASGEQGAVLLLELSAADDLPGFQRAVEEDGLGVDAVAPWYGRWGRRMGFELRTPLMVAAACGSTAVLEYIIAAGAADVNRACGTDGATALHCAAAGGSVEAVRMLVDAAADVGVVDALGKRPGDVVPRQVSPGGATKAKCLKALLKVPPGDAAAKGDESPSKKEKKDYPPDLTLPDIKNGVYSTDEFRMYAFKVKPCSRAYSHDWTECPFVHPGENARRRDPRKYHYSCVPCPEFRKGACRSGDACDYAHGVFECWLHPAQYRTRLCKDEAGCSRRVCFFAHKPEELRPLYTSGSGAAPSSPAASVVPSPRSPALAPLDVAAAALLLNQPLTPSSSSPSAMASAAAWLSQASGVMTPTLQLPASRLKASLSARNLDMDMDLMGLEAAYQQQLVDDVANMSSPSSWKRALAAAAAADAFGSLDSSSVLSHLQGLSLRQPSAAGSGAATLFQSPHQNVSQQLLSGYNYSSSSLPSPPSMRASLSSSSSSFGLDRSLSTAIMTPKASAFAKRSQSFCDRGGVSRPSGLGMASLAAAAAPGLSDWGSPDGKLDWGIQGEELNKLRKSASFGFRSGGGGGGAGVVMGGSMEEPDVSWVQSLVKDSPSMAGHLRAPPPPPPQQQQQQQQKQYQVNNGKEYSSAAETLPSWMEQLYAEQEQMVA